MHRKSRVQIESGHVRLRLVLYFRSSFVNKLVEHPQARCPRLLGDAPCGRLLMSAISSTLVRPEFSRFPIVSGIGAVRLTLIQGGCADGSQPQPDQLLRRGVTTRRYN